MTLNKPYFMLAILILFVEVLIALHLDTGFIRYTFGDYLVVILIYCTIKSFIKTTSKVIAIGVLLFAYFIEFLQYINIVNLLNLQNNKILSTLIGTTFSVFDLIAYTLGVLTILSVEIKIFNHD